MGYLYLAAAIVCEVIATLSLKASDGFSKPAFSVIVVIGYLAAFIGLSYALQRGIPLGVAYGLWAAIGVAAIALLSVPVFGETLSALQGLGLVLVMVGVFALELGGAH